MPRELHLSIELNGTGHHPADADPTAALTAAHWADLVRLAEQGALDFVTVGDCPAQSPDGSGAGGGRLDAVAVLARVAPVTSRIGLVPTVTTTHTEPFHTSTALAKLDVLSEGRAGWQVDVSTTEAPALGRFPRASAAELWAEATDTAEFAARLWDSWDDDAGIREDAATGRFTDRDGLHHRDFDCPHSTVRGPSMVPRPPQGRPPLAVALDVHDSDAQWELAAGHADVALLDADHPATARLARAALQHRTAEAGRDPDALRVLVRVAVDLGSGAGPGPHSLPPADTVRFTGTAADLAGLLGDWHAAGGADGFHLLSASAPADLPAVVHELVPPLRERGIFRTDYTGGTLRDHLGLPRPAGRYVRRTDTAR
jgi:alkanesulfonate monooxygenase SsuD/methylene tetrahydromethanopterin reductase-like flavin-dependent oxidoreductase (luciferase family)